MSLNVSYQTFPVITTMSTNIIPSDGSLSRDGLPSASTTPSVVPGTITKLFRYLFTSNSDMMQDLQAAPVISLSTENLDIPHEVFATPNRVIHPLDSISTPITRGSGDTNPPMYKIGHVVTFTKPNNAHYHCHGRCC